MVSRDPHSFGPDDPPVTLPRKLACELLEREEMLRDMVERRTDREDTWGRRVIESLKVVLEA